MQMEEAMILMTKLILFLLKCCWNFLVWMVTLPFRIVLLPFILIMPKSMKESLDKKNQSSKQYPNSSVKKSSTHLPKGSQTLTQAIDEYILYPEK